MAVNKKVTKNKEHDFISDTVVKLVKPEILKEQKSFPREYKILKKLLNIYTDHKIWLNIDFQVNSLAFFLTPQGKQEIEKVNNKINFKVKEKEYAKVGNEKMGDSIAVDKVLTLKEFLK